MGDPSAAQQTLERALAIAEVAQHDRMIPEIWMAIVLVDTSLGRLAEASRGLDRATAFFTRQQPPRESLARLHSKRAAVLRALGRHREAIAVEDQALALYRAGPEPEVFEAGSLTMQATSYAAIGAWERALELDRQALALRERQLGPEHTRVAGSLNNIGVALMATGALEAARAPILRALAIREALQGPDGLDVAKVLLSLAELERLNHRPAIARAHLEHALAIRERVLGRQHPLVAEALHRLGALRIDEGELAAALSSLDRARAIMETSVGATHPTTALVVATLAHAELARGPQMNLVTPAKWMNYIVAPLAFLAAGLGEISCVFLYSGTTLLLVATWRAKKQNQVWAKRSFETLFIAWLFLLLGMIALIVSPSNARVANMNVKRSNPLIVPFFSLKHAIDFIVFSLKDLPLPHVVFIGMMLGLGIITTQADDSILTVKRVAILLAFTTLITYLLITAIQAPSAYFYSATPDPRGQSLSRFTLLLGIAVMAWIAGMWAAKNITGQWLVLASVVVMLAGFAYTARSITNIYSEIDGFIYRARVWDERDAIIATEKAQGNMLIEVPAIDTGLIHTRDMFGSTGKGWKQFSLNCGARYYGVDGLKVKQ